MTDQFHGMFQPEIVVIGLNKIALVPVKEIPFTTDDAFMQLVSPG